MWVLGKITNADQSLVSSLNIAAFNLGNALGAWAGGMVIAQDGGLPWIPYVAALMPIASLLIAVVAIRRERAPAIPVACAS
jgi:DHA1 family inner membrane transport protein